MPRAISKVETKKYPLKSVPDGYVVLRKLTYGEDLRVRGMSMRMHMDQESLGKARKEAEAAGLDAPDIEMTVDVDSVTAYMFSKCIVDHNLTDADDKPLNFKSRADFQRLDKEVGEEIEDYVQEMNPTEKLEADKEEKVDPNDPKAPLASDSGKQSTPEK